MALDKNQDLITYPCKVSLASITSNDVAIGDDFALTLSSITMRVSSRTSKNGVVYNISITGTLAGLDNDTFTVLDQYLKEEYQARVQYDDGKIFQVATIDTPMRLETSTINNTHNISLDTTSLTAPEYLLNINDQQEGFTYTLTFTLA